MSYGNILTSLFAGVTAVVIYQRFLPKSTHVLPERAVDILFAG